MSIAEPAKIITPWANTGSKNPIPQNANNTTGEAGYDKGFPDITMTPPEAGGIPPAGQDFNGILFEITSVIRYIQAGGQPSFSSAIATAIGGYPSGALVLGGDGVTIWQSQVGSNMDNPDVTPTNWKKVDVNLRQALAAAGGVSLVNGANYRFVTAAEMASQTVFEPRDGDVCATSGYYTQADGGGATYTYASASTATVDGFLVHNCAAGGRWMLVDNRSRLPFQVAGAKVDGATDDRAALLAAFAAKRPMSLSGIMRINGAVIDLTPYIVAQSFKIDIEGNDPINCRIEFATGAGGFKATSFFRGFTLKNINIKNATSDKTGVGFINPAGAEMIDWENVTFTGWRIGPALHCWNSKLMGLASRDCYYAGSIMGTSTKIGSHYSNKCNYGFAVGLQFNEDTGLIGAPVGAVAFAYSDIGSMACDTSGPYLFGKCHNVNVVSMGVEGGKGGSIIDLQFWPIATFRQNLKIQTLDVYVQAGDAPTTIFNAPANAYGGLSISDVRLYSDKAIPVFNGDGKGIKIKNIGYNRDVLSSAANGITIFEETVIGSDYAQLTRAGYLIGGYGKTRKVNALIAMPISATSKLVIRLQDTAVTGLAQGILACGEINFYPVHKGGGNSSRECGKAIFSVGADYAGALTSVNLQKFGVLTSLTATNRLVGTDQELVLSFNAAGAQYICEANFICNGKFAANSVDYYTEA